MERASSEKTKEHRKLNKVSSSPVVVPRPEVESKKLSSSWGRTSTTASGDNNGIIVLRSRKFMPRIETIRASTGDKHSKDDLDLLGWKNTGVGQGAQLGIESSSESAGGKGAAEPSLIAIL